MTELFSAILATSTPPVDSHDALVRDLRTFLFTAGNQLCDDCRDTLAHEAGMLLKRMEQEKL